SVAIPVRNGGARLREVLEAVRAQTVEAELVVADSRSTDGSAELARSFGATVFTVERFSHGGTRNELMERTSGDVVAFLTQDAVPASDQWLAALLRGFTHEVALVYGPSLPRQDAPVPVAREMTEWFSPVPRVDRGRDLRGPGLETFFTSTNGAVLRAAWRDVPFPDVPYAEDQALALAMLRAGYAKAYVPEAAVIHSHDYGPLEQFRRTFDEWRALRDVHGLVQPLAPVNTLLALQNNVRADLRAGAGPVRSARHHAIRTLGAALGSRADRLPERLRRWCSLEGRG
ncbi:MAG TPA: glycosyltransferase family 2 protein, partial [Solirubrobacter sp.]|nr:glycosyltransferase family 2 protein [Solirubrobacter sp.]